MCTYSDEKEIVTGIHDNPPTYNTSKQGRPSPQNQWRLSTLFQNMFQSLRQIFPMTFFKKNLFIHSNFQITFLLIYSKFVTSFLFSQNVYISHLFRIFFYISPLLSQNLCTFFPVFVFLASPILTMMIYASCFTLTGRLCLKAWTCSGIGFRVQPLKYCQNQL